MEIDRPKTSGRPPSERPLHHWKQEDADLNRPLTERPQIGRPQTRIERPVSRRGEQNGEQIRGVSGYRAGTPTRTSLRPPSASTYSRRGSTANTRLNTMASAMGMARINTNIPPTAHANSGMMERPVTQQGVSGIRPGTTRGLTRQIQDKRYYDGLIQLKIRELTQEISVISREIDIQNKERTAFSHYDDRAKKLAAELTDLQGKLADYNIVIDKVTSNINKESIEREFQELQTLNDKSSEDIERLFEQRRLKEQQLRNMEEKIESEEKKEERIVEAMPSEIRSRYDELVMIRNDLELEIGCMQKEIDVLSTEKLNLEEQIALSQIKQEAVKLRVRMAEVEERKVKLLEEQKNKLTPEMEREKLLAKVKQDNMDIVAAEKRISDVKKQIDQIENELEHLEIDMEDNQLEKQVKYNELRKREEAIEQFMPSFDHNKSEEMEKIFNLEGKIVEKLKRLAFSIDNETGFDELTMLDVISEGKADENEHLKLQHTLRKMETVEKKLRRELLEVKEKMKLKKNEMSALEDIESLEARNEANLDKLMKKKEELLKRVPNLEEEMEVVKREHQELEKGLHKNEIYEQMSALEDKYEQLKGGNESLKKIIEEGREKTNYIGLKEKVISVVQLYNDILNDSPRTLY